MVVSLRPGSLAGFNPDAHTSTPFNSTPDAFQLRPDVRSYRTTPTKRAAAKYALEKLARFGGARELARRAAARRALADAAAALANEADGAWGDVAARTFATELEKASSA